MPWSGLAGNRATTMSFGYGRNFGGPRGLLFYVRCTRRLVLECLPGKPFSRQDRGDLGIWTTQDMPPRITATLLCGLLLLATACNRGAQDNTPAASTEPASAVLHLAERLHQNDLAGFARDAVPPEQYAQLDAAWRDGRSRWPLTELPLDEQLVPLLTVLTSPDAEQTLQQAYERQFAHQHRDLKAAARSLGLFGVQYISHEGQYSDEERAHYVQVVRALSEWAEQAPLGNPAQAHEAIVTLAAAAQKASIQDEAALRGIGMEEGLTRLSPFFAAFKEVAARYGLALDDSLAGLRIGKVEQRGDQASVHIHYPLAGKDIEAVIQLKRRGGHWFPASYLAHADALPPPAAGNVDEVAGPVAGP